MITIIFGPAGCGKTANLNYLRTKFDAHRVLDGWHGDMSRAKEELQEGDLAMTNVDLSNVMDQHRNYRIIPYHIAISV